MSPRNSSQSDKQAGSPAHPTVVTNHEQCNSKTLMPNSEKLSPQEANAESHHVKTARMEATAAQGYGGGIPAKIEEGIEPGDPMAKVE